MKPLATVNGSSKAVRLNKITRVLDRKFPPLTLAFSGPRIKPLLEVLSLAVNGSSEAVLLDKTITEHGPDLPLDHGLPGPRSGSS